MPRPPVEKLPLSARKTIKDDYTTQIAELTEQTTALMGVPWTFEPNFNWVFAYTEESSFGRNCFGGCIYQYFSSAVSALKRYVDRHGDDAIAAINSQAPKHVISLEPGPPHPQLEPHCACDFHDGALRLRFREDAFGTNVTDAADNLDAALNEAEQRPTASSGSGSAPSLSSYARRSIAESFTSRAEELRSEIARLVGMPSLTLQPNFAANYAAIDAIPADRRPVAEIWQSELGHQTFKYFDALREYLLRKGFREDEMLREGFAEAVEKAVVELRVVEKLVDGKHEFCEAVIEGGVLVLRVRGERWGADPSEAVRDLMDLL